MARAFLLILDSFGCGSAADAVAYGDSGADTLGHIAAACARSTADRAGLRHGPLHLPNLSALGLGLAAEASTGTFPAGLTRSTRPGSFWGYAVETALGKDTPSGHWEIAGAPAKTPFGHFPLTIPCFPRELTDALIKASGIPGLIGNKHGSGTEIIREFGVEHVRTGQPICYTSADSVFQIAAHEAVLNPIQLYDLCKHARKILDKYNICRVIARPFIGYDKNTFTRTSNRKDFAVLPPKDNLLQRMTESQRHVISVGKIGDIFCHTDTGTEYKASNNEEHIVITLNSMDKLDEGGLLFANFVDFDTDFGHRRDVAGYAACLEAFDRRVPEILSRMKLGDMLVISADHGNDPTWPGTEHTREHVPIVGYKSSCMGGPVGRRKSFADIAATIASHLCIAAPAEGISWAEIC